MSKFIKQAKNNRKLLQNIIKYRNTQKLMRKTIQSRERVCKKRSCFSQWLWWWLIKFVLCGSFTLRPELVEPASVNLSEHTHGSVPCVFLSQNLTLIYFSVSSSK